MEKLSDEQIIELYKAGDDEAFNELYRRYEKTIRSVSRSFFLPDGDKYDVMQYALLGLFKAVKSFNGKSSFKTYAYKCMRTAIISEIKVAHSDKNKPLNDAISIYNVLPDVEKLAESDPEQTLIHDESASEILLKIQSKLSKMENDVFKYYIEGYSYTEISEFMGKDAKSIDNALQRIKKKINELI